MGESPINHKEVDSKPQPPGLPGKDVKMYTCWIANRDRWTWDFYETKPVYLLDGSGPPGYISIEKVEFEKADNIVVMDGGLFRDYGESGCLPIPAEEHPFLTVLETIDIPYPYQPSPDYGFVKDDGSYE